MIRKIKSIFLWQQALFEKILFVKLQFWNQFYDERIVI